jgi:hypothetical protein
MRHFLRGLMVLVLLIAAAGLGAAQAKAGTLKCVGLYSETSDGYVSYRVGTGAWVVIKVGDTIPANGEIRVNVDRDWIEVIPAPRLGGRGHQEGRGHPQRQAENGELSQGQRQHA